MKFVLESNPCKCESTQVIVLSKTFQFFARNMPTLKIWSWISKQKTSNQTDKRSTQQTNQPANQQTNQYQNQTKNKENQTI